MQFCTHERATEGGSFFGFLTFFSKYSIFPTESLHILFSSFLWQVYFPWYPIGVRFFLKFIELLPKYSIFPLQNLSIFCSYPSYGSCIFLDIRLESGFFFQFYWVFSQIFYFSPSESLHILFLSSRSFEYIPWYPIRIRIFFRFYWIFSKIFYFPPSESLHILFPDYLYLVY